MKKPFKRRKIPQRRYTQTELYRYYDKKSKAERPGSDTGLLDMNGCNLRVGDYIIVDERVQSSGILLYSPSIRKYGAFRGRWYGENVYDHRSYGKMTIINDDNGMRMTIRKVSRTEWEEFEETR